MFNVVNICLSFLAFLFFSVTLRPPPTALDCGELLAPRNCFVTYDGADKAVLRCNHTLKTWHLFCRDNQWLENGEHLETVHKDKVGTS